MKKTISDLLDDGSTGAKRLGLIWMLVTMVAISIGLGDRALMDPDEGRNAVVAQEMAVSGDLLIPRLNGLPFLDKPFLYFSAAAACIRLFGSSEFAVRLPALLSAWATLGLTAWFAARLFGRRSAWIAGTACATSLLNVAYARTVIFDSMLSFFVTLSLVSFYMAIEGKRRGWVVLAWSSMACGVFTKGPVALLLPLLVAIPYALWSRRLRAILHPAGWLVFLALVLPWLALTEARIPGFLHYSLWVETWSRVTTDSMQRTGPIWYFLPALLIGTFPWIVVALAGRWQRSDRPALFLWFWLVLPFVFFSLSESKRYGYVLPLVPAIALLAARTWAGASSPRRAVRVCALGWIAFGVLMVSVGAGLGLDEVQPDVATLARSLARGLAALSIASAILAWLSSRHRVLAPIALSLPLVLLPSISSSLMGRIAEGRSSKAIAAATAAQMTPRSEIVGIETYTPSFAFYLRQPILVSSVSGKRFRSNYIEHYYEALVAEEGSTLKPAGWWKERLASCAQPDLFLVRLNNPRPELESAGLPLVHVDERREIWGPCRPSETESSEQEPRE